MSFGITVTLLACIAHRHESSNNPTRNASEASCRALIAWDWNLNCWPSVTVWTISLNKRENGRAGMSKSVLFWNFLISRKAFIPGWYLLVVGFFIFFLVSFVIFVLLLLLCLDTTTVDFTVGFCFVLVFFVVLTDWLGLARFLSSSALPSSFEPEFSRSSSEEPLLSADPEDLLADFPAGGLGLGLDNLRFLSWLCDPPTPEQRPLYMIYIYRICVCGALKLYNRFAWKWIVKREKIDRTRQRNRQLGDWKLFYKLKSTCLCNSMMILLNTLDHISS